jgi:hypothetical protein
MNAAQRVSRGFHRLGIVLAALALLFGVLFSVSHCPKSERLWKGSCQGHPVAVSDLTGEMVIYNGKKWVPYSWWTEFFSYGLAEIVSSLPITLAVAIIIYGIVRGIGWVIGGFAAS